ncbi:MAG TPA: GGDEF domain-containing protein [Oscillospiraceae bacterium]|nr:GGDEF domain-containing protein [Oscillospiraceae bacterium]
MDDRGSGMSNGRPAIQLDKIYDEESAHLEECWRGIHLRAMMIFTLAVVTAEIGMAFLLRSSAIVTLSLFDYCVRYVAIPAGVYVLIDGVALWVYFGSVLKDRRLDYFLSLAFAALCMAVCFFHDYFVVAYTAGVAAIAMTTNYSDRRLTGVTALATLLATLLLSVFGRWDTATPRDETYFINVILVVLVDFGAYFVSVMVVRREDQRRRAVLLRQFEIERLRRTAERDQLTGVRNRTGLRSHINETTGILTYAMMDIDHFKSVNDLWGHTAGDGVLAGLGRIFSLRENRAIAAFRYGGDEFLLTFSDCSAEEVNAVCREVRNRFREFIPKEMREAGIDLSFGVSPSGVRRTPSEGIRLADEALYKAKRARFVDLSREET